MRILVLAALLAAPQTPPPLPPPPPPCLLIIQTAGVSGKPITYESIGRVYAAALSLRLKDRKEFTRADLDGAAHDLDTCFNFATGTTVTPQ